MNIQLVQAFRKIAHVCPCDCTFKYLFEINAVLCKSTYVCRFMLTWFVALISSLPCWPMHTAKKYY